MIDNKYKYDEFTYVSKLLKEGFQTHHDYTEMCLIAAYCRDILQMNLKEQKKYLIEFCKKHVDDFNYVLWYKKINRVMNFSSKNIPLVTVPYVNIYEGELNYINFFDIEYNHKKLMFTFLTYMKLDYHYRMLREGKDYKNKIFRGGKEKYNHIKKIANISLKFSDYMHLLHSLNQSGYIKVLHSGKIALEYLSDCHEAGKAVMQVKDYNNIGWYFDYYNGIPRMNLCDECSQPFKKEANSQVYCKKCACMLKNRNELARKQKQRILTSIL